MKKTLKLTVALLGFAMIFGTSCGKYEEGPGISLRSKKARLANTWTITKTVSKDGDEDVWDADKKEAFTLEIKKDGTFTQKNTFSFGGTTTTTETSGEWEFTDGKEKLKTTVTDGGTTTTTEATIILLKNKEMGSMDEDGNKTYFEEK